MPMRAVVRLRHELAGFFNQRLPVRLPASSAIQALKLTIGLHHAFFGRFRRAAIALCGRSAGLWSSGTNGSIWFGFFICDRGKSWFGEPEVRGTNFLGAG
jgi:hypothetical protein